MLAAALIGSFLAAMLPLAAAEAGRIEPYPNNPYYWQFKNKPVLLLGGTWQDNLFNHPAGLEKHLDLLAARGGNYVRNTMSHRNTGNAFAYAQRDGKFDLDQWNQEFWRRFDNFLKLTRERDIIVQIEIWDPWDHYVDHQSLGGWSKHPFNPANNLNYTAEKSRLPTQVKYEPRGEPTEHAFFRSVPELDNNELVLRYQRAFVDKLLSYSLAHPHVLYCMNNETGERVEWGDYWAKYVREKAEAAGVKVHTTDMRRSENVRSKDHTHIFDNPGLYSFVDISQNNAWTGRGQDHYDRILWVRERLAKTPRPINNNKNYGAARHGEEESVARFCRIVLAGCASVRFHRPHPREDADAHEAATEFGLGLSPRAQAIIASMREIANSVELVRTKPRNDLLSERAPNEAYCLADPGKQYAIYFPDGGAVKLDLSDAKGKLQVRWLDIDRTEWQEPRTVEGGGTVELDAPRKGHWAVVVLARQPSLTHRSE
jgi:predicted SprT family Zn-dependent metalloprotease